MKLSVLKLTLFSLLFPVAVFAKLEIVVKSTPDWGPMKNSDVEYLCQNVVDHFEKHLRLENQIDAAVNVYRTNVGHNFVTLDVADPNVKYKIGIQPIEEDGIGYRITDFFYVIQPFTHEFLHVLQDHTDKLFDNEKDPNLWLMEGIATMSSIWSLREMAKEWKNGSKFGVDLWQGDGKGYNFSDSFNHFANQLEDKHYFQLTGTPAEWLEKYEDAMREVSLKSHAGLHFPVPPEQLAFRFVHIFQDNPEAWNIVPKMPFTNSKMQEYMQEWYDAVDVQDRQYVESIAEIMDITVTSKVTTPVLASTDIDADIDNNGFVDLSDVMLVRSAIQNPMPYDTDVNNDGKTDETDLRIVKAKATEAIAAAAPSLIRKRKVKIGTWGQLKSRQ